jgi:peroxiredoxin
MYPHERSLVKRLAEEKFTLLGINSDESPEKYAAAAKREDLTWPVMFDGGSTNGPIATKWGVRGWPTIYVIDAKGVIRFRDVRGDQMDAAVDQLLAEAKAEDKRPAGRAPEGR